jgi:hypothetical protein
MAMLDKEKVLETINMIRLHNFDIRTVTLAVSLRDCISEDIDRVCDKVAFKLKSYAENLVEYASIIEDISRTDDYQEDTTFTNFIDEYNKLTGNNLDLTSGEDDVRMTDQGLTVFYTDKEGKEQSKLLNTMVKELVGIKAKIKLEPYVEATKNVTNSLNKGMSNIV